MLCVCRDEHYGVSNHRLFNKQIVHDSSHKIPVSPGDRWNPSGLFWEISANIWLFLPGIQPCQCLNGGVCPDPRFPTQCRCQQPYYGTLCESRKYWIYMHFFYLSKTIQCNKHHTQRVKYSFRAIVENSLMTIRHHTFYESPRNFSESYNPTKHCEKFTTFRTNIVHNILLYM